MTRCPPIRHIDPASFALSDDARAFRDTLRLEPPNPASAATVTRWHPAFVSPLARSAERVEEFVSRLGFGCWWPRMTVLEKRPARNGAVSPMRGTASRYVTRAVKRPLWPRYILISLPSEGAPFGRLSDDQARSFGLHGIVSNGAGPAVIPDAVVVDLQRREAAGEWDRTNRRGRKVVAKPPDWAVTGGRVQVADGPFATFHAIIEELIGDRAKVSVNIFGRTTPIDLHLSQLKPSR